MIVLEILRFSEEYFCPCMKFNNGCNVLSEYNHCVTIRFVNSFCNNACSPCLGFPEIRPTVHTVVIVSQIDRLLKFSSLYSMKISVGIPKYKMQQAEMVLGLTNFCTWLC